MIRRAAKRDESEPAIVAALEAVGATVQRLSAAGVPDLLVSFRGRLELLEVKDVDRSERRTPHRRNAEFDLPGCLTPAQVKWWRAWLAGGGRPPRIVLNADEALEAIGMVPHERLLPRPDGTRWRP